MTKVYQIKADVDRFQSFLISDDRLAVSRAYLFDGTPVAHWFPPPVEVRDPTLSAGDFGGFNATSWSVAASPHALASPECLSFLEAGGQILPLYYGEQEFGLVNITTQVDALDAAHSVWVHGKRTKQPIRIERYAFHPDRLPSSSLFKIPQTMAILCHETDDSPQGFKSMIERLGFEGLIFHELWSS
jgi:hypothetical protein